MRRWLVAAAVAVGCAGLNAAAAAAFPGRHVASVSVTGAVATPATYSLSQLGAMPQTSFTVTQRAWWRTRTHSDTGVSVEDLVNTAAPTLPPATKNAFLRVTVTVADRFGRSVTLALGELDPGFGSHPAYLALVQDGRPLSAPELVVPGDSLGLRSLDDVSAITVAVQSPAATTPPSAGALTIIDGGHSRILTAAQLAALPSETLQVTFLAGSTPQTHTEIGPSLAMVLRAARVRSGLNTWVAGVGSDAYVAVVTPAEQWVGGRPLQISLNEDGAALAEPRLVVDGDVKGGRYVSDLVDLVVGHALRVGAPWWR
jgi:hypothetical protein